MVNGPQAQVAFQGAEGFFDEHQLHIATPEQFGIVGAQVGAQEIPAFALADGAQFLAVKPEGELARFRHGGVDQGSDGTAGAVACAAEFFQPLVAGEVLLLDFVQALPESLELAAAHAALFADARAAFGQHIDFALLRQEFDAQLLAHLLPGFVRQFLFQFRQPAFGRADEVTDLRLALPQFGQHGFGGNAPVHHPDAFGCAVALLNQFQHVPQRGFVGGIAGEHFIGQRQPLGRDDQRHDDLHAVATFVATITEAAGIAFIIRHVALEVGAGQVVEQHVELRAKEIAPA